MPSFLPFPMPISTPTKQLSAEEIKQLLESLPPDDRVAVKADQVEGLSDVAKTGDYSSLEGLPSIPSKLSELTEDIDVAYKSDIPEIPEVPSKLSELTNDTSFIKLSDIPEIKVPSKLSELVNDMSFLKPSDIPNISVPTKISDLINDSSFIRMSDVPAIPTRISQLVNDAAFATTSQIPVVPTKVSAFSNDAAYITQPDTTTVYTSTGRMRNPKIWVGAATCDANGKWTIDYTSAGFTVPPYITPTAQLTTATSILTDRCWATLEAGHTKTSANGYVVRGLVMTLLGGTLRVAPQGTIVLVTAIGV